MFGIVSAASAAWAQTPVPASATPARPVVPGAPRANSAPTFRDVATDYVTPRYEPAGFPIVAGNTDIGLYLGGVARITRFQGGRRPYFWSMDLSLGASLKVGPRGLEFVQQSYEWQSDIIGLLDGWLRLNPAVFFFRTINYGYWGIGNASPSSPAADYTGEPGRFFQFRLSEFWAYLAGRLTLHGPFSVSLSPVYRFVSPEPYADSQLARDAAVIEPSGAPRIYGVRPLHLVQLSARFIYDTRDSEIMPTRGLAYGLWLQYTRGFPLDADVAYMATGVSLSHYVPIAGPFVLAARLVVDLEFGRVPFYDLARGATPYMLNMPGGGGAIRGVPSARYAGPFKIFGNIEIRALLVSFRLLGQNFRLGLSAFFDAGRVWSDYTFNSPLDGAGPGLKFGTGLGAYLRWGQATIFRAEIAYSPDAASANSGFPFGIYITDGVMF